MTLESSSKSVTTIVEFLLARIAEDEEDVESSKVDDTEWYMPSAWTRKRWRAECEAKRRIVERYRHSQESFRQYPNSGNGMSVMVMDEVLKILAQPYANYADFREEWRL